MSAEDDLKMAWRAQSEPQPACLPQELRVAAQAFQDRIARRNRREYIGGAIVVPVFCFYAWFFPYWVTKLGAVLVVLGTLVVMWQLHKRASARSLPRDFGQTGLQFQREELQRQRDALHDVWRWYLGPLLPGLFVFMWGQQDGQAGTAEAIVDLIMVLVFVAIHAINRRAAKKLQAEIDALDRLADVESH
ncbi:hypothetical protein WG899_11620 [Paucibacter sp. AS339]|uniref:hypothetical protein n=1 Tax=Paucibacter hankyongi TaxID=3133434 RepID=UPI0030AB0B2E